MNLLLILIVTLIVSTNSSIINPSKVTQISWKPRAFVYKGFLTDDECNHLISLAKTELTRSEVADSDSGESKLSEVRTSSGMFITKAKISVNTKTQGKFVLIFLEISTSHLIYEKMSELGDVKGLYGLTELQYVVDQHILSGEDPIVSGVEDKIATWTFLPKDNGEDIQVLHYESGQKYDPHYDYFSDEVNIARGGHRIATVLMYLSDVEKGGETVFPEAEEPHRRRSVAADEDFSECAKKGVAVKPRKGDALLFFSLHPTAIPDPMSLHGGCPVIAGEKWSATKWIHVDAFDKILAPTGNCTDSNNNCDRWASLGECTKNPEYMVGTPDLPGSCRRSCKVC